MTRDDTIQEESERDCAPAPAPAHEHERVHDHDRDRDRERIYALPSLVPARLPPSPTTQDASAHVQGQGQGEVAYVPVSAPSPVSVSSPSPSLSRSFCPTNAVLPAARLSADAAAVGTTPETLAHILPQWADARLSAGKRAADWYADFRKFARSYLEHERHDHDHDQAHAHDPRRPRDAPGAPGSRASPAASITRAPSTDKYTLTAVASSLNALDRLIGKGAGECTPPPAPPPG